MKKNYKELLNEIRSFVFDVDGVFTDNKVHIFPNGEFVRTMNVRDGYALQLAVKKGYNVAIITGGNSKAVKKRFEYLGVKHIYLGSSNKLNVFNQLIKNSEFNSNEILYMGDDIPDLEVMQSVALATSPIDACEEVKAISHYVSDKKGGEGCIRDVIEQTLRVQGKWMSGDHNEW